MRCEDEEAHARTFILRMAYLHNATIRSPMWAGPQPEGAT